MIGTILYARITGFYFDLTKISEFTLKIYSGIAALAVIAGLINIVRQYNTVVMKMQQRDLLKTTFEKTDYLIDCINRINYYVKHNHTIPCELYDHLQNIDLNLVNISVLSSANYFNLELYDSWKRYLEQKDVWNKMHKLLLETCKDYQINSMDNLISHYEISGKYVKKLEEILDICKQIRRILGNELKS